MPVSASTVSAPSDDNGSMSGVRFVRRVDDVAYEFVLTGESYGYPVYRRVGLDVWCRRLADFGWVVCNGACEVSSRPFGDAGCGARPPEGVWVSLKGDRSYVYDLVHIAD